MLTYLLTGLNSALIVSAANITLGFLYIQGSTSWVQESFSQFKLGIQDVNNDDTVLPNDTLDYILYNTYGLESKALEGATSLINRGVVGLVGTGYSSALSFAGAYASLSKIPMVSPGSTAISLIDKRRYPFVMRSISNDGSALKVLLALCGRFGWKRMAALLDEEFEDVASQLLRPGLQAEGISYLTLSYKGIFNSEEQLISGNIASLQGTMRLLRSSGYKILLLYCKDIDSLSISNVASEEGIGWESETHVWLGLATLWSAVGRFKSSVIAVLPAATVSSKMDWFLTRWRNVTTLYNESIHGAYNATTGLPFYGSATHSNIVWDTDYAPTGDGLPDIWGMYVYDTVRLYALALHSLRDQGVDVYDGEQLKDELLKTLFVGITGPVFFDQATQDRVQPIEIFKGNATGIPFFLAKSTADLAAWDFSSSCGDTCTTLNIETVPWSLGVGATPDDGRKLDMEKTSIVSTGSRHREGSSLQIKVLARNSFHEPPCFDQCQDNSSSSACLTCIEQEYDQLSFRFVDMTSNSSVFPVEAAVRGLILANGELNVLFPKGFRGDVAPDRSLTMIVSYKGDVFPETFVLNFYSEAETVNMSSDISSDLHLIIVLLCIFVGVSTCLIISLRLIRVLIRYPRRKDSPVDLLSATGKWTHEWVGERIHGRIREVSDINLSKMKWSSSISMSADFSLESLTLTWHSAWLVNASPFRLVIRAGKFVHVLPPTSCSKGSIDSESEFSVQVVQTETFVTVTSEDWQRKPPEPDSTQGSVTYDSDVARFALPPSGDGSSQGWLKLVRGGRGALLLCWSPPHIQRGIPIDEFMAILSSAQEQTKSSRRVGRTSTERIFSQVLTSKKVPQAVSLNMYQICNQVVLPLASSKDSSYAELFTDYGLPDIFISHVWSTRSKETLKAIRCLSDLNTERNVTGDSPRRKSSSASDLRLWFCTFCNNQSRVSQELGDDVQSSPFAQVLGVVDTIAILEPLVALKRKWCNFELVLAKQLGRSVHMVTSGGVVGAGQVTPKVLEQMALELIGFNCKDATCASDEDAIRIDSAVCQMGGYDKLTAEVCAVFLDSISQASETMHRALHHAKSSSRWSHIQSNDNPSPVLDCMERGRRCKEEDLPEASSNKTLVPRWENGKLNLWL